MRARTLVAGLALAATGASAAAWASSAAKAPPSLSGRWVLNAADSDDARAKMREAGGGRRGPGGGGFGGRGGFGGGPRGGMGGGMGGMGGGMGGRRRGPEGGGGREGMRAALEAPLELTITATAAEIAVLEKDGRLRSLHPDAKGYKDSAGAEVKSRWDDDRLVVETKGDDGRKVVETFALESPKRLVVGLQLETWSGAPVTVRRVYDAASDGKP